MKGKFGIAALLLSSITFAAPVSTPTNVNDTPIISGGGKVSGGICRAYQADGTAVNLSGGETLVFYGGGASVYIPRSYYWCGAPATEGVPPNPDVRSGTWILWVSTSGGFLSTKTTYSGTAYLKVRGSFYKYEDYYTNLGVSHGSGIGLFTTNSTNQADFIAGAAGAKAIVYCAKISGDDIWARSSGGGWSLGEIYATSSSWFGSPMTSLFFGMGYITYGISNGFGAGPTYFNTGITWNLDGSSEGWIDISARRSISAISAFYNSHTKNYTLLTPSFTIDGGGSLTNSPVLYVCQ